MMKVSPYILNTVLGFDQQTAWEFSGEIATPQGVELTAKQQRAIAPLVCLGAPKWSTNSEYQAAVKSEAGRRIIELIPEWKQRNLTARMLDLVGKQVAGLTLNGDELDEQLAIRSTWEVVAAIRTISGEIEELSPQPSGYLELFEEFNTRLS
ncbi:hypothetical protein [Rubellicoccus peritrichatus]|uniref:Uncharacterized protein n=1 Tax=Rubellicoccus peritrichatus TaxID=3080537 RepID=A0AAQ3L6S2_9BACT|nr:hypothetical protein [Puniceicoccus sp. CR14]WOO40370.1 hypothetical protein RZN69_17260 [Puniceicoccus sp. CR14]WOO40419.1 hypothetical protein RZN69_17505 [Puniceicoccus sp. CR14]WOO40468.1 hypothetical protein RZN69_17750 [Puniceicoccus sp. CR14]WOO40517.1 hypothetical protein RZN69_17995 [Puniceicoccus sp. CR14]